MSIRDTISRFMDGSFKAFSSRLTRVQGLGVLEFARGAYAWEGFPDVAIRSGGVLQPHLGVRTETDTGSDLFGTEYSTASDDGSSLTCTSGSPNVSGPSGQFANVEEGDYFYIQGDETPFTVSTKTDDENLILSTNVSVDRAGSGTWRSATPGVNVEMMFAASAFQPILPIILEGLPIVVQMAADWVPSGALRVIQWNTTGVKTDLYARLDLSHILYKLDGFNNATAHWKFVEIDPQWGDSATGLKLRLVRVSSSGSRDVLLEIDSAGSSHTFSPLQDLIPYAYAYVLELFCATGDLEDIGAGPAGYQTPASLDAVRLVLRQYAGA